jgi:hypothetical protein
VLLIALLVAGWYRRQTGIGERDKKHATHFAWVRPVMASLRGPYDATPAGRRRRGHRSIFEALRLSGPSDLVDPRPEPCLLWPIDSALAHYFGCRYLVRAHLLKERPEKTVKNRLDR